MQPATIQPHGPSAAVVIAFDWIPLVFGLVAILARLHWRFNISGQRLSTNDACLCLAWCFAVANASFDIYSYQAGVLTPHMDYALGEYKGSLEKLEKLLQVSDCIFC